MADGTGIEWTDATWNPVRGCTRVSEGCRHCYAEKVAARFSGEGQPYHRYAERRSAGSAWTGRVEMIPGALEIPLGWKRPRRIFANSMSDLFHEALPDQDIATVYGHAIAAARVRGHTIQILTKRARRMRELLADPLWWRRACETAQDLVQEHSRTGATDRVPHYRAGNPPPGIWLGVSVENQDAADERIPDLLGTPAAVRFISAEPLLGPVDLTRVARGSWGDGTAIHALAGGVRWWDTEAAPAGFASGGARIAWVIAGGESGPGFRPVDPAWMRSLRDQCQAAGVAFFAKQMSGLKQHMPPLPDDLQIRQFPTEERP
jgi:protein gp37